MTSPPSRMRRFALRLCLLLLMYVVTELLLFAAISIKFGRMFSFSGFEAY